MIRTVVLFPVLWLAIANAARGQLVQRGQDSPNDAGSQAVRS